MAKILIVHGISNQYLGESELHNVWFPAICDGLRRAEISEMPSSNDCFCPFYGDLFRPIGSLSGSAPLNLANLDQDELELLAKVWESAAATDDQVPSPRDFEDTLVWAPRTIERALASLARSPYLARLVPLQFLGDLRQVVFYLNRLTIRTQILNRVTKEIGPDTRLVIGHSLGSVIAYEAMHQMPAVTADLLTVGSPLGIRSIVFDKLTPRPKKGRGQWPGSVRNWTNIAAAGDIVAAKKDLRPLFGPPLKDRLIDSGWDAHSSTRYLNNRDAGTAIAQALK